MEREVGPHGSVAGAGVCREGSGQMPRRDQGDEGRAQGPGPLTVDFESR